jgi:hypothetical protein
MMRRSLAVKWSRVLATLALVWASAVAISSGRFVYLLIRRASVESEVVGLRAGVDASRRRLTALEEELLEGSSVHIGDLERQIPVELDVTRATRLVLDEMSRHETESLQYQVLDPATWDGPAMGSFYVQADAFTLSFRCSFSTLLDLSRGLQALPRLTLVRSVSIQAHQGDLLQVTLVLHVLRRTLPGGEMS